MSDQQQPEGRMTRRRRVIAGVWIGLGVFGGLMATRPATATFFFEGLVPARRPQPHPDRQSPEPSTSAPRPPVVREK